MKIVVTVLVLVATTELVLGVPGYGPPQPLPVSPKYNRPHPNGGAPIPAKYPQPHFGGNSGKNEFYSKFNPHSLPPGVRGPPPPQLPPHFGKYPPPPPPGKYQQHQHQHQQQQQQQHQHQPHHPVNFRPLGPQFQSKPHLLPNGGPPQGQIGGGGQERLQQAQSRPVPKITNVYGTAPKVPGPPDFPPRFPAPVAPVQPPVPFQETSKGPYIINSDDERGPIKTIPAPNLNPADKPANFEEQLYRAQHQQSYAQPLDNSIIDERPSYQVTEDPSKYKPFSGQPSYFAPDPDTVPTPKVPPTTDINSIPTVGKVPLDIALQQHLDKQHQQQLSAEQSAGASETLTPHELYSLLNGNPTAVVSPQTAFMVSQPVVYAVPQPLDVQAGHQVQYQQQSVPLPYAQQPAATAVHLQYAQPAATDLQYLQPQTVQYQPQAVQYQPQAVQYQPQAVHYQNFHQRPAEQYSVQPTAEGPAYEHQANHQQEQEQQQQQQQQQQQYQQQQQQQEQEREQQEQQQQEQEQKHDQLREQQQDREQLQDNDVQYQQQDDYQPRNRDKAEAAAIEQEEREAEQDQNKFESIRNQYYSAVPNEQTAGVLAQIAESAANNDAAAVAADEPSRVDTVKPAAAAADQTVQLKTTVQIQQSVPLYEGTYASSRRTNQEYADEGGDGELMEGSESVASVSGSPSVNGHAPSQFPYNAAKINAFSAN